MCSCYKTFENTDQDNVGAFDEEDDDYADPL